MRVASWSVWLRCLVGVVVWLLVGAGVASANISPVLGGTGSSLFESQLVIPEAQSLLGSELESSAVEAKRLNPEAVLAREQSLRRFANLSADQAEAVLNGKFSGLVDHSLGGPPSLPSGQWITSFLNADAAQVELGGGQHAIIESSVPMAVGSSHGRWAPVNLALVEAGGGFEPVNPLTEVHIPRRVGDGVGLSGMGLSLTPVDASGAVLGGAEGVVDGSTVLYANTQQDADTVVKPTPLGFDTTTVLRSVESPSELEYRIGVPQGARLVQDGVDGVVRVVKEGATIASVSPPAAMDAEGTFVPTKMSVSGDTLDVSVSDHSGSFLYPIAVDPEFHTISESLTTSNWHPSGGAGYTLNGEHGALQISHTGSFVTGDTAYWSMQSDGDSKIYGFSFEDSLAPVFYSSQYEYKASTYGYLSAWVQLARAGVESHVLQLSGTPYLTNGTLCANSSCSPEGVAEHNAASFNLATNESSKYLEENGYSELVPFSGYLDSVTSYIAQPKETHATVSYTTSLTVNETTNVLSGSGAWMGPDSGAFEFTAADAGLGVAMTKLEYDGSKGWEVLHSRYYLGENTCQGVQCNPSESEAFTFAMIDWLPNGEDHIRVAADDPMANTWSSEHGEGEAILKIDTTPPHGITLTGLPTKGEELQLGEVEAHVKAEATDGEGEVKSSGIKSLELYVDGREIGGAAGESARAAGYCSPGPCTGTGEWPINGAELGVGEHKLTLKATDNAGNIETKSFVLDVSAASPVAIGPGSVNPESGDFAMEAADVDVSGGSGALSLARHYDSLNPKEGAIGPLGPQWTVSTESLAKLEALPDESVMSIGPDGLTHFTVKEGGGFEAPKGDTNLTLEFEPKADEYLLKDAAKGTVTGFTQPEGTQSTQPEYSDDFGSMAPEDGQLDGPSGVAVDSEGDVWVANQLSNKLDKYSSKGRFIASYAPDSMLAPQGVAASSYNGNVYVSNSGQDRVDEVSRSGSLVTSFGGAGAGGGQFNTPDAIAVASSGNVWVTDFYNDRVEEFSSSGGYITSIGKEGAGEGQLRYPSGVAVCNSTIYVVDQGENRVKEFSSEGKQTGEFGKEGKGNGEFKEPSRIVCEPGGGNVYVTDKGNDRVQEFSSSGSFLESFGSAGAGEEQFETPIGIAIAANGAVYVGDHANNRVEVWTHPVWMPTISKGPVATDTVTDTYQARMVEGHTVIEPKLELAPHATANCEPAQLEKLEIAAKGCRALEFVYASATTAKGENKTEWGEYNGRLQEVKLVAYNSATAKMVASSVAKYEYDAQGRLRAEYNPELPELKTFYGYDAEGHVTAVTAPGRETWAMTYGTIPGDASLGRLVKIMRPAPSEKLWGGEAPANTTLPMVSGTPIVGVRMAVTNGQWSHEPLTYGYQWEDCNSEGKDCAPIPGATNANYTPTKSDIGQRIVAVVSAINGGGTVAASTTATTSVALALTPKYSSTLDSEGTSEGKLEGPLYIAQGSNGNLWITEGCVCGNLLRNRIQEFNEKGEFKLDFDSHQGSTATNGAWGIAVDSKSHVWVATAEGNVEEYTEKGENIAHYGKKGTGGGEFKEPGGLAIDAHNNIWVADQGNNRVEELNEKGEFVLAFGFGVSNGENKFEICKSSCRAGIEGSGNGQFTHPYGIALIPSGVAVVDNGNNRVEEFNEKGEYLRQFGSKGNNPGQFNGPIGIATERLGHLWVVDGGNSRVEEFNEIGEYLTEFGGPSSVEKQFESPRGIGLDSKGDVWVIEGIERGRKLEKWTVASTSEGETRPVQPGATIEYNTPLEGPGAPAQMGLNEETGKPEPAKWGQKDDPEYATSIFPPEEPQGWPASGHKQATTYYMDSQARTVNVAGPSGGVATTEYNEDNEVERSLGADNRATALKEKEESRSIEVSKLLDTESVYNGEGQLIETLGPQHTVRLAHGKEKANEEVLARNHVKYSYDEGAPEGETYDLVTKTTDGAQTASKEEFDVRTTITSYGGQGTLGWKLRSPTSVTTDPTGLDLTSTTEYNEAGQVIQTKSPAGSSVAVSPPVFSSSFGSEGTSEGKLKGPAGVALDATGNVWVDDRENNRIEKFSGTGSFDAAYGSKGSGAGQMEGAWGIAVNQSTGNVYVADSANNRIDEFSSSGAFVETIGWGVKDGKAELETCTSSCKAGLAGAGNGQLSYPMGVAIDAKGDLFIADDGNDRIVELSATGTYLTAFASKGSGNGQLLEPAALAFDEGELYVVDKGNDRIEEFSPGGTYLNQFGSKGTGSGQFKEALGIAVSPNTGDIYVSDAGESRVQQFTPAGRFLVEFGIWGTGPGGLEGPDGLAVNTSGDVYISELYDGHVAQWAPPGSGGAHMSYSTQFGTPGSGEGQFNHPAASAVDGQGNVWVTDYNNSRVEKFNALGKFLASYGSPGTGEGQFKHPTGIAINQSTGNVYVADCEADRIEELSSTGGYVRAFGSYGTEPGKFNCPGGVKIDSSGNVWVADVYNNRIEEFSSTGTFIAAHGAKGSGNEQFIEPTGIAISGSDVYVADTGNDRIEELSTSGSYVGQFGSEGTGGGQFNRPESIATDAAGDLYVADTGNNRVQEFSPSGQFLMAFASHGSGDGQLSSPQGVTISSAGDAYVTDVANNRVEVWAPTSQAVHDTKMIYYTAAVNSEYPNCGGNIQWENLPCETTPAGQPQDSPKLPVTTIAYNMWDQPETVTEKFGSIERTKKTVFENSGRPTSTLETSSVDEKLPEVTDKYNKTTGGLETQSTKVGETMETITSLYNTYGELESYTDAAGNTAKYAYDQYGRLKEMSDSSNSAKSKQAYGYSETTGQIVTLEDNAAKTFTATYDPEGKMTSEGYPNGMTAYYTYNPTGAATSLEYKKLTHCTEKCTWFSDSIVPSIHGETLKQASTLSEEPTYTYDNVGRLTQVQEIPAGEKCTTRAYAYDEESNRTSQTTYKPNSKGECATEEGTTQRHIYDEANRLSDEGIKYEELGNTTLLPESDAGGKELTSSYYVDGQVHTQAQNKKELEYKPDPEGRTLETKATENLTTTTTIDHYDAPGGALAWTAESGGSWTRDIPGIGGELAAIQANGGEPTLQLHDLQGDIVATALMSETATELHTKYNSTEFGVPNSKEAPPKYAWLGAGGVASELPTGIITQDGATYVPQTGRVLQTQGVAPPIPLNAATPFVSTIEPWVAEVAATTAAHQVALAEEQRKAIEEANTPPGTTPLPEEEAAGEGIGFKSNACSGTGACAASHHGLCRIIMKFGEPFGNELWAVANYKCTQKVAGFEVQVCLYEESSITGKSEVACNHSKGKKSRGQAWTNTKEDAGYVKEFCITGFNYRAWSWGRVYGMGALNEVISPGYTPQWHCTGEGSADEWENFFTYSTDGAWTLSGE